MSGKVILLLIIFLVPVTAPGKLIKTSLISDVKETDLRINRNIFSPRKISGSVQSGSSKMISPLNKPEPKKKEETTEDKVIAMVFYEGFLFKGDRKYALLKVNGQYYISGEGDKIPGSILLKKILEKKVLLEIESAEIIITKKGEKDVN
ncbi:MAG: hypothetical protein ABFR36_01200 [Acidobacteriota bacterium]